MLFSWLVMKVQRRYCYFADLLPTCEVRCYADKLSFDDSFSEPLTCWSLFCGSKLEVVNDKNINLIFEIYNHDLKKILVFPLGSDEHVMIRLENGCLIVCYEYNKM